MRSFSSRDSVLVIDFENQTGDPWFDHALRTAFVVSLEQSNRANIFPQIRTGPVLRLMGRAETDRITPELGREICQRENIRGLIAGSGTRTGKEYALSAELIDPTIGTTVRSYEQRSYGEEHILDALDVIAAGVRRDLGEPLYQIHRAGNSLPEVTTSSFAALNQYPRELISGIGDATKNRLLCFALRHKQSRSLPWLTRRWVELTSAT